MQPSMYLYFSDKFLNFAIVTFGISTDFSLLSTSLLPKVRLSYVSFVEYPLKHNIFEST